ncbi:S1C family serine protease [Alkaliphilus crotonatoxidans]
MTVKDETEIIQERGSGKLLKMVGFLVLAGLLMVTGLATYLLMDYALDTYGDQLRSHGSIEDQGEAESIMAQSPGADDNEMLGALYEIGGGTAKKSIQELAGLKSEVVRIETASGQGSGVIISREGYVISNWHLVKGNETVNTFFQNHHKEAFRAKVLQYDEMMDLALLQLDRLPEGIELTTIPLGDASKLKVGEEVVAIGSPRGLMNTVSEGLISDFKKIDGVAYIQNTASLSPGSAGGALVNTRGELIGINTFRVMESENVSLAISVENVQAFLDDYLENLN